MLSAVAAMFVWGLNPGIDFVGGTLIDVSYPDGRPDQAAITASLSSIDQSASIRASGEDGYIIRMNEISQERKDEVMSALSLQGSHILVENSFDSVGPTLGIEALRKSLVSIVLVLVGIVLYITFAFRKVSEPVSSWKYGLVAIAALIHDVVIPVGVFSVFGYYFGYEVDTLFVTALLVILGFSIHDTIVVFDRVRENLKEDLKKTFDVVVGESVNQTISRSINTSLTTLIALIVLYFLGSQSTQEFALVLIIGIAAGTYSSIFIASPLLVTIEKWGKKKQP